MNTYLVTFLFVLRKMAVLKLSSSVKLLLFMVRELSMFFYWTLSFQIFFPDSTHILLMFSCRRPPSVLSNAFLCSFVHFKASSLTIQTDNLLSNTTAQSALQMSLCRKQSLIFSANISNVKLCLLLPRQVGLFNMLLCPHLKTFRRHA